MTTRIATMNVARLLLLALLVVGKSLLSASQTEVERPSSGSAILNLCELLSRPENFYGKTVRVKAHFRRLVSNEAILFSKDCDSKERVVSVGYDKTLLDQVSQEIENALNAWRVDEAEITVVGRFHGPLSATSEPNYGHMGRYKYQLEVLRLEQIKRPQKK